MGGCVIDLTGRPAIESMEQMFGYFSGELIHSNRGWALSHFRGVALGGCDFLLAVRLGAD